MRAISCSIWRKCGKLFGFLGSTQFAIAKSSFGFFAPATASPWPMVLRAARVSDTQHAHCSQSLHLPHALQVQVPPVLEQLLAQLLHCPPRPECWVHTGKWSSVRTGAKDGGFAAVTRWYRKGCTLSAVRHVASSAAVWRRSRAANSGAELSHAIAKTKCNARALKASFDNTKGA